MGKWIEIGIWISVIILLISNIITKKEIDREKISIYECGFKDKKDYLENKAGKYMKEDEKYYIKYYKIGIVYLIFDLETMLLYPSMVVINKMNINGYIGWITFIVLLIIGLIYEVKKGIF